MGGVVYRGEGENECWKVEKAVLRELCVLFLLFPTQRWVGST